MVPAPVAASLSAGCYLPHPSPANDLVHKTKDDDPALFSRLIVTVTVLLSACAVGPDYHRPAAPTEAAFKESAGWKPSTPRAAGSAAAWWSIYNDPLLDQYERQIDISNQTLKASEAAYRQSVAIVDEASASFFPTVTLNASVARQPG